MLLNVCLPPSININPDRNDYTKRCVSEAKIVLLI